MPMRKIDIKGLLLQGICNTVVQDYLIIVCSYWNLFAKTIRKCLLNMSCRENFILWKLKFQAYAKTITRNRIRAKIRYLKNAHYWIFSITGIKKKRNHHPENCIITNLQFLNYSRRLKGYFYVKKQKMDSKLTKILKLKKFSAWAVIILKNHVNLIKKA